MKKQKRTKKAIIPDGRIERSIKTVRGEKVLLDSDLAALYEVSTRTLLQAVKRNASRFPPDFMFQLTLREDLNLRSQIVISSEKRKWGGRRYRPYAFTEHGVAMMSSVLRGRRAVQVNIEIVRVFVRVRQMMTAHEALMNRLTAIEAKSDRRFKEVFDVLRELISERIPVRRQIGFSAAQIDQSRAQSAINRQCAIANPIPQSPIANPQSKRVSARRRASSHPNPDSRAVRRPAPVDRERP